MKPLEDNAASGISPSNCSVHVAVNRPALFPLLIGTRSDDVMGLLRV
ncbi:hypothetical protein [Ochrobactrum sp. POC9]|nr:hypothetical protein [Ochrobactrum sp. POC9]MCH4539537.1 hypothetical protein [Ochrobactrum sp. A-1]